MEENGHDKDRRNIDWDWRDLMIFGTGLVIVSICIKGIFFDK